MPRCGKCGKEFDSERGLKVHNSQVHDGETAEVLETKKKANVGNFTFRLNIRHALVLAFIVGIMTGGFFSLMAVQIGGATGFIASDDGNNQAPTDGNNPSGDSIDPSEISLEGEPVLGDKDAPVTIVEFSDYQCPFCRKFALEAFEQIKTNYVDTGKVKIVFKDFPLEQLGHNRAVLMSEAANCASEQDQYWEMHDKMFAKQQEISPQRTAKFPAEEVTTWAEEIGLNMNQFNQCMDSDKHLSEIREDLQEGQKVGVSGTPTFFINGKKVVGAQPYSAFKQVIESELQG